MPMSASAVVNRAELLAMIDELRDRRDGPHRRAAGGRRPDAVLDGAVARPSRSSPTPRTSASTYSDTTSSTWPSARPTISSARRAEADELRKETDEYVDAKLANFEITLERTMEAVKRGRERLAGRTALDSLTDDEVDKIVLPEHLER